MTNKDLESLRTKILETTAFPTVYMFKFIVLSDNRKIAMVENLFDENAEIHTKESGSGKYISITSRQVAMNVDEIIEVYHKASSIEGIMFL
jgi:putative lipoic acid-binding regulatory protein